MSLSALPKAFGLSELRKGFFPHLFNTPQNENAHLQNLPEIKFYSPETMSVEKKKEFDIWYEENKNKEFDFQKEILEYCISDVDKF